MSATVSSFEFNSSIAEHKLALSIYPQYSSKVNIDHVKIGGVISYSYVFLNKTNSMWAQNN